MWVALAGRGHSQSGVTFRGKVKRCPKAPPLQVQPTQLRHPPSILHGFRGARRRPSQHPRPQGTPPLGFTPYKSPQSFLHSQRPVEAKGREERQPRPHPGRHQSPTCPPRAGEPCAQCIPSTRSRFPPSQGHQASHRPTLLSPLLPTLQPQGGKSFSPCSRALLRQANYHCLLKTVEGNLIPGFSKGTDL